MAKTTEPDDVELAAYQQLKRIADNLEEIHGLLAAMVDQHGSVSVSISGTVATEDAGE